MLSEDNQIKLESIKINRKYQNIWRLNTMVQVSDEFFKYSELKENMFSKSLRNPKTKVTRK